MKRVLTYILVLLLSSCQSHTVFDESIFDEVVYTPRYATGFEIRRHSESGATLITSQNPWQGAEGVSYKLLIDPSRHFASAADVQHIDRAAERIICMSSSHIAMLDAMGEVERVVGVSGIDFISNSHITSNRQRIGDVGYDNNINYELLIALDPDTQYAKGAKRFVHYWSSDSVTIIENGFYESGHQTLGFEKDWRVNVTDSIDGPGEYTFSLIPVDNGGMVTRNYRLLVNGKEVAKADAPADKNTKTVQFKVPAVPKGAKVEVQLTAQCNDGWFGCSGHIRMEKK